MKNFMDYLQKRYPHVYFKKDQNMIAYSDSENFNPRSYVTQSTLEDHEDDLNMSNFKSMWQKTLNKKYPYLYFSVFDKGTISIWFRRFDEDGTVRDGTAVHTNDFQLYDLKKKSRMISTLNNKAKEVHLSNGKLFYCSVCGKVQKESKRFGNLWAGVYCKECVSKSEHIQKEFKASSAPGYFD